MKNQTLNQQINLIKSGIRDVNSIIIKDFYIGEEAPIEATLIYLNGLADKNIIDSLILNTLMHRVKENLNNKENLTDYLCKKYITSSDVYASNDIPHVIECLKKGKAVVVINNQVEYILIDASIGYTRSVSEPINESTIRGSKGGFVENLETNINILRRMIKDKNLIVENFIIGQKSQTDVVIVYLDDIMNKDVLNNIKSQISSIDVDIVNISGIIEQSIEKFTYSIFPQTRQTERPDVVAANLMEGRVAILVDGIPHAVLAPAVFIDFFESVEDYYQRTIIASFSRILRYIAAFIVITGPALYLSSIKFNADFIPIKFITPIIQSRMGIALTPLMEILAMELTVEFLREGGLRLPSKIAQTLSVVGGIIIGNAAISAKLVSSFTVLIVGIGVIAAFLIPNYEMSLTIRILRFPMLLIANNLGVFGITFVWYIIIVYLCSLDSFGVQYFDFKLKDMKDTFIRAPLWQMDERPTPFVKNNSTRQKDSKDISQSFSNSNDNRLKINYKNKKINTKK